MVPQIYGGHLLHFSFPLEGSKAFMNLSYASCNNQCCLCSFQYFFIRDMLENDTVHKTCQLGFCLSTSEKNFVLVY